MPSSLPYAEREDLRQHLRNTYDRGAHTSREYTAGGEEQWLYAGIPDSICKAPALKIEDSTNKEVSNDPATVGQQGHYGVDP